MIWIYALGAVGIVSLVSFAGLVTLALRESALKRIVFVLVGLATGALFETRSFTSFPKRWRALLGRWVPELP